MTGWARRVVAGPPHRDVGTPEWAWRPVVVGLVVLLAVLGLGAVVLPDAVGWRFLALVVGLVASQVAQRRFRRWQRLSRR